MLRAARDEQGAELLEAAFSMMAILIFIFGAIEACWAVYGLHYVANVAHEAARYAIVRGASWPGTCDGNGTAGSGYASSMCEASPADIANFVASRNFPGLNIAASDVCVEYFSSVPAAASTSCSGNTGPRAVGYIVQVTVSYPFTLTLPVLPAYTWNLASTSHMVIAQ